jgi:hypothetical protein
MKLRQFAIATIALVPFALGIITTVGMPSAMASRQTDTEWNQYLKGRKFVQFSRYSSSYGGGGMSSKEELHFCSNGQFSFASGGSVSIYGGDLNATSVERDSAIGKWKVIESNSYAVLVRFVARGGETQDSYLGFGEDGHIYNSEGERLYTDASDVCQ